MSPSFWRVAAGACMIAAGLFAGSSAIAQAAPDSSADGGSSRSHSPNADSHSSNVDRKPGQVGGNSSKAGSTSANRGRSGFGPAANSGPKARQPYANSAKVPTANAVASVPVASVPEAIQQAASSAASTIRQISQAAASSSASPAPIAVTPNTAPSKALEPLTSMVESVAKAAHALVDVANQFIDGVLTPTPTVGINPVGAINNGGPVRAPAISRIEPGSELQTLSQPGSMLPGRLPMVIDAGAPAVEGATGVITPQLLSNQLPANASTPSATTPTATSLSPNWLSGIASQIFHGVREALRNVSLTELALAALPGVAGLLFFFATGVGLGRRQAKFGFAMASSGAMRFAVRGPLGVVRNGSTVAVHTRKKSASSKADTASPASGRQPRLRHLRLIDRAA